MTQSDPVRPHGPLRSPNTAREYRGLRADPETPFSHHTRIVQSPYAQFDIFLTIQLVTWLVKILFLDFAQTFVFYICFQFNIFFFIFNFSFHFFSLCFQNVYILNKIKNLEKKEKINDKLELQFQIFGMRKL